MMAIQTVMDVQSMVFMEFLEVTRPHILPQLREQVDKSANYMLEGAELEAEINNTAATVMKQKEVETQIKRVLFESTSWLNS